MVFCTDDYVEIAWRAPLRPGCPLCLNPDALPIAGSGLDTNLERLGALHRTLPVTHRAGRNVLARTMAARAGDVELLASARLLDGSFAFALRTHPRLFDIAIAIAIAACIAASDVQPNYPAADGRPERHVNLVFEIIARLRPFLGCGAASAKNVGEDIAETPRFRTPSPAPPAFVH